MPGVRVGISGNPFPPIIRNYIPITSQSTPRQFSLPEDTPEAYAEWGEPSDFQHDVIPDLSDFGIRFNVVGEIAPLTRTLLQRVENPDDESQFVDVERYERATFKNGKTGRKITLDFDTSRFT